MSPSPHTRAFNRRRFLRLLFATGGVAGFAMAYARFVELHWVDFARRELPVGGLDPALDGRTLVQFSDIHVGPRVDDEFLRSTFRRVNKLSPDFVVGTGDWVSYREPGHLRQLDRVLAEFPRGRLGTAGVLGNHDYGDGWRDLEVARDVSAIAAKHGIEMLRNRAVRLGGLQVIGIDDWWSPCFGPRPVLAAHGHDPGAVVLCHNPDVADQPVWEGYAGWILAGHTHGGQCKPPFLPPPMLPVRNRRYTAGEFDVGGGRRLYINRGLGHLLPFRCNVRPEVTIFTLRAA